MYSHQFISFFQWNLNFRVHRKKEYYISLHQQSIIKFLKRNSKLFVMNRRRHIFHGIWNVSSWFTQPIEHPSIVRLSSTCWSSSLSFSFSQDDRFFPRMWRIVARLKAVGSIWAKGNVAYNGEKAFSWEKAEKDGKGIVSCQVYDVFLISFIDVMGIHVSGWYILIFTDMVVVKLQ